jgi:hypothetical protein
MTENHDRIEAALAGLRQNLGAQISPYILSTHLVNEEDRKQIISGVMNVLAESLGRFLATLEFQGIIVEGSSLEEAVFAFKNDHLTALAEREKAIRDAHGVGCDA